MRVATLNTWGMRGDWRARLPVLRDGLRAVDADIVTLQETILTGGTDQAADLLGQGYHLAQQQDREKDGQGITTASRWRLGRVFEVGLHVTERTYPGSPARPRAGAPPAGGRGGPQAGVAGRGITRARDRGRGHGCR